VPDDVKRRDLKFGHQSPQVLRKTLLVIACCLTTVAQSRQICRDHAIPFSEIRHDVAPLEPRLRPAVQENDGVASAAAHLVPAYRPSLQRSARKQFSEHVVGQLARPGWGRNQKHF
jgi:hypothetical protein